MGIVVSPDSGTTFEVGAAQYIAVAALDANTFVVAYQDADDSNHGKAVIGTRSGTTIYVNSSDIVEFSSGDIDNIDVCALSSTLFVISYVDDLVVPVRSHVIAGSVSGTTITFGSSVLAQNTGAGTSTTICEMDSTNFVVSTSVTTASGVYTATGVVSGTTITMGTVYALTGTASVSCSNLNSTDFILTWRRTTYIDSVVGVVNTGTQTIAFGTTKAFSFTPTELKVASFDYNHFVIFYINATDNYVIGGSIGTGSTRVITFGSAVSDTTNITDIKICTMDSTHFLVSYKDADDSNYGKVRAGSLTGSTTLAWDDEGAITFDTATITYTGVCNLDGEYFLIGFKHT